jgi:uncharacterized membrane protein YcaP (DUF421 family)
MSSAWRFLARVWGDGESLDAVSMVVRAGTMFFLLLVMIRVAGARSFARKSSFDNVVVIMLGAVAARGVVGASPFGSTVAACAVVVALHRLIGRLCVTVGWVSRLVEGTPVLLFKEGRLLCENLKVATISEADLLESHRLELNSPVLSPREAAYLERNGRISFVRDAPAGEP